MMGQGIVNLRAGIEKLADAGHRIVVEERPRVITLQPMDDFLRAACEANDEPAVCECGAVGRVEQRAPAGGDDLLLARRHALARLALPAAEDGLALDADDLWDGATRQFFDNGVLSRTDFVYLRDLVTLRMVMRG